MYSIAKHILNLITRKA